MPTLITGNILEQHGFLLHQVNTLGKFNAGLARQIRLKWPEVAKDYENHCARGATLGDCLISSLDNDKNAMSEKQVHVVHLFAQESIGRTGTHTRYCALADALITARRLIKGKCYFPYRMGCGLGGGDWDFVKALITETFPDCYIVRLP